MSNETVGQTWALLSAREKEIKVLRDKWLKLQLDKIAFRERARWWSHPQNKTWLDAAEIVENEQEVIGGEIERLQRMTDKDFERVV